MHGLLLHSAFMLSVMKLLLKGGGGGLESVHFSSHGNYIVDHGISCENHGIVFLNFCGNPVLMTSIFLYLGFKDSLRFFNSLL